MPSKRTVLEQLKRDELLAALDEFGLEVQDRRYNDQLVDALASSRKASLAEILGELPRTRLKEICLALGLDDHGREKAVLIGRLTGTPVSSSPAPLAPTTASEPKSPPRPEKSPARKQDTTANLGFEAKLWQAADALRNNMDAAEYKHVVLGLIFLKYISDAFEAKHAELEAEKAQGADPEDPDEYRAASIFWVPKEARWQHLKASAPQPTIGTLVDDAMSAIERDNPSLKEAGLVPAQADHKGRPYEDIPGFCKSATLEDIRKHGHVLTPGRYVGAEEEEDDGEPFEEKMSRLAATLYEQQEEAAKLDAAIAANLKEFGHGR